MDPAGLRPPQPREAGSPPRVSNGFPSAARGFPPAAGAQSFGDPPRTAVLGCDGRLGTVMLSPLPGFPRFPAPTPAAWLWRSGRAGQWGVCHTQGPSAVGPGPFGAQAVRAPLAGGPVPTVRTRPGPGHTSVGVDELPPSDNACKDLARKPQGGFQHPDFTSGPRRRAERQVLPGEWTTALQGLATHGEHAPDLMASARSDP